MSRRRKWMQLLIPAAAVSAAIQYTIQGVLASGHNPADMPGWFWVVDYAFWAIRSLIEAGVIVYLFSTQARNGRQGATLLFMEASLILLIALTIGPALRALGLGLPMAETVSEQAFWLWNFGLAAYTALMMAGTGYAYRVQPYDGEEQMVRLADVQAWQVAHEDAGDGQSRRKCKWTKWRGG